MAAAPAQTSYDVVIVGGGVHGLAAAYYLAANHGITDVAVLEKGYIGGGGSGRNTAILRSNYLTPEGVRFYDRSVKLYQRLAAELDYNVMFSQRGHLTLAHSDASLRTMRWRAEVNKMEGVASEVIGLAEVKRLVPFLDVSTAARYPVLGALYHPPGGIIRHDAVVWGYARGASAHGVHIHQNTEVIGIDVADGRVRGVLTGHATAVGTEAARRAAGIATAWLRASPGRRGTVPPAQEQAPVRMPVLNVQDHPELFAGRTNGFVDFSEDVTAKDLRAAVAEGFYSPELAKRFTTATMGPLQGKLEAVNTIAIIAAAAGSSIAEVGTTTWRPPYAPVSLAALAGPAFEPVRYSPMQSWHEAHGAVPLVAGAWIRPDHYGDAAAEARNVRERVGLIDVTPIGKLDLRGPDVTRLLNMLYVNKWSRLEIGRVRYGVMCAEDGVVLDDGVTGRLGEHHYLMSTTSSGAATVWEWAENWLQTEHPDWAVHVTPVTTAYASMNVAGPQARRLMQRVTEDVDLSNEAFGYMHVRTGRIAGVGGCVLPR